MRISSAAGAAGRASSPRSGGAACRARRRPSRWSTRRQFDLGAPLEDEEPGLVVGDGPDAVGELAASRSAGEASGEFHLFGREPPSPVGDAGPVVGEDEDPPSGMRSGRERDVVKGEGSPTGRGGADRRLKAERGRGVRRRGRREGRAGGRRGLRGGGAGRPPWLGRRLPCGCGGCFRRRGPGRVPVLSGSAGWVERTSAVRVRRLLGNVDFEAGQGLGSTLDDKVVRHVRPLARQSLPAWGISSSVYGVCRPATRTICGVAVMRRQPECLVITGDTEQRDLRNRGPGGYPWWGVQRPTPCAPEAWPSRTIGRSTCPTLDDVSYAPLTNPRGLPSERCIWRRGLQRRSHKGDVRCLPRFLVEVLWRQGGRPPLTPSGRGTMGCAKNAVPAGTR